MKKIYLFFCIIFLTIKVQADDVNATVTNSIIGLDNGSITLSFTAGIAPYTFSWTGPDGFTSTEQNIMELAAGEYCVTVTDNYCGVANLCVTVEEEIQSSNANVAITEIIIQPNPFSSSFHVAFTAQFSGDFIFIIYDTQGKQISEIKHTVIAGFNSILLSPSAVLASGEYFLGIIDETQNRIVMQLLHLP